MDEKELTLGGLVPLFTLRLRLMYSPDEARRLAFYVASSALGKSRADMLLEKDLVLTDDECKQVNSILTQLMLGTPVQYVLGKAEFLDREFLVDQGVLIPRPETEELVQWVISDIKAAHGEGRDLKILDIGTGSGCIAISIKLEVPGSEVWGLDVSPYALGNASCNAEKLSAVIHLLQFDILGDEKPAALPLFDLIVSNPPYVPVTEKSLMRANVLDYEPEIALFVNASRPLVFYEAIIAFSANSLKRGSPIFFEINENMGLQVCQLLSDKGYAAIELRKDINGKDRFVKASKK